MRRPIALLALLALSAGAAACGGDGDDTSGSSSDQATGTFVDDRTADEALADFDIADAAVLQLADLPAGWKGAVSDEEDAADEALVTCANPPHRDVVENERAAAERKYELGDSTLYSDVVVYPDDAYANEAFDFVRMDAYLECYRAALLDALRQEFNDSDAAIQVDAQVQRLPDPALGDEAAAIRIDVTASGPGGQFLMVFDFIAVRVGRTLTSVGAAGTGGPFDPVEADRLVRLSTDRISAV